MCVAGALRDGVCAYTALHTHARMAAGHTLLVMDGASVCKKTNTIYQRTGRLGDIAEEYTHHVTATITQDGPIQRLVLQHVFPIVLYF